MGFVYSVNLFKLASSLCVLFAFLFYFYLDSISILLCPSLVIQFYFNCISLEFFLIYVSMERVLVELTVER